MLGAGNRGRLFPTWEIKNLLFAQFNRVVLNEIRRVSDDPHRRLHWVDSFSKEQSFRDCFQGYLITFVANVRVKRILR